MNGVLLLELSDELLDPLELLDIEFELYEFNCDLDEDFTFDPAFSPLFWGFPLTEIS